MHTAPHNNTPLSFNKTPFDILAKSYFEDFKKNTPIKGGMMFFEQLKECQLDGSMDSLKYLDKLLNTIKTKFAQNPTFDENTLIKQSEFRNFLLFLGFYMGQIAALKLKKSSAFIGYQDINKHFVADDTHKFYMTMAMYPNHSIVHRPFFVLIVLANVLFNKKICNPITNQHIPASIYWATLAYLDEYLPSPAQNNLATQQPKSPQNKHLDNKHNTPSNNTPTAAKPINAQNSTKITQSMPANQNQAISKPTPRQKIAPKIKHNFEEIKNDLSNMPAINAPHNDAFVKVNDFVNKIYQKIGDERGNLALMFNDNQKNSIKKALDNLQKLADLGNTNAKILLAICYFDEIAKITDDNSPKPQATYDKLGFALVEQAANMGDVRAQKFLSRLYYQGLGTAMSLEQGEFWVERAADGGHSEAIKLRNQLNLVRMIKDDIAEQNHQDQNYLKLLAVASVVLIFAIWLSVKFLQ